MPDRIRTRPGDSPTQRQLEHQVDWLMPVALRAIGVFGDAGRAGRWLKRPIRSLDDQAPVTLLHSTQGRKLVLDVLGRIEHGVLD